MKELKTKKSAEGPRVKKKSDTLPRAAKRMLRAGLMEKQASQQRETQEKAPERAAEDQVAVSYTHLDVYKRQVRDYCGNVLTYPVEVSNIDLLAPAADYEVIPGDWTNKPVTIRVTSIFAAIASSMFWYVVAGGLIGLVIAGVISRAPRPFDTEGGN